MLTLKEALLHIQGEKVQEKGQSFENKIADILKERGIYYIQIPQSSRVIKDRKTGKLITVLRSNPFDFLIFLKRNDGSLWTANEAVHYFDTKTTKNLQIPRSYFIKKSEGKPRKKNPKRKRRKESQRTQYEEMVKNFIETGFDQSGFVIQFGDQDPRPENVRFFYTEEIMEIFSQRACLSHTEGVCFNKWLDIYTE